jgi:hypothetical protein
MKTFDLDAHPRLARFYEFGRSLCDFEFRELLTPRLMPTLYLLAIAASAYAVVAYAIDGFVASLTLGLTRALLVGPFAFLVLVTLSRVALELCAVVFRIAVHINEMAGHTEDIAGGLPRIQFWKSPKRRGERVDR